ncbi:MAG: hypothetical protein GWP04_11810 [Gammaproteobacteria bacterium]|nr:hypothetical protein [Gammaproteobacteria bacterium]
MRLRRFGVITLVMAMVLSLAGLAYADDPAPAGAEATAGSAPAVEPGSEDFTLYVDPAADPLVELLEFAFYWGFPEGDGEDPCSELQDGGQCLDVSGPNGQVNHGQFVSAFVHWLKSEDGMDALSGYEGKKGHLIKQVAKSDLGKGQWKKDHGLIAADDLSELEAPEVEAPDAHGSNHANGHEKKKNK